MSKGKIVSEDIQTVSFGMTWVLGKSRKYHLPIFKWFLSKYTVKHEYKEQDYN